MSALAVLLPGFEGPVLPEWLAEQLRAGLGGVCLFGTNVESPGQVRALTDAVVAAQPRAVVAIDEEGGDVTRLYGADGSPDPGNGWLGRHDDLATTGLAGATIATRLASLGITLNLAPVADVNADPRNPVIGVRSFGADPGLVARHVAAWVSAHEAAGVATCPKHFPGHGDTSTDSHVARPVVGAPADVLERRDLPPFAAAVAAGARTVMTSHLVVPALDPDTVATFSRPILGDLLRDRLGFQGAVVSDALDMAGASDGIGIPEAAVRALAAGCDLLCLGTATTPELLARVVAAVEAAVAEGRLPAERLADAAARVALLAGPRQPAPTLPTGFGGDVSGAAPYTSAFEVSPRARDLLASVPSWTILQLEAEANIAAGEVPWGPGASVPVLRLAAGEPLPVVDGPVAVVGRDLGRRDWTREVVDRLRASGQPVLVVDMGTPDPERRYADLATYGGSRLLGAALLGLLAPGPATTEVD